MVATNGSDYRHSSETELLAGLRAGHTLALAEAYHRTVAGVHAAARRLLGSPREVEGLLTSLYADLWGEPPSEPPLEGWLRARSFALGSAELRARGAAPASASLAPLLPDLPRPPPPNDALERELAELEDTERQVLVAAFDLGRPSLHQDQAGAPAALDRALRTLAGPDPPGDDAGNWSSPCREVEGLADWTLGLLGRGEGEAVGTAVAERADCHARARRLRRGRRRLEGLPPPPDVGQRIIARVLAQEVAAPAPSSPRIATVGSPDADTAVSATVTGAAPPPEAPPAAGPGTADVAPGAAPGAAPAEPDAINPERAAAADLGTPADPGAAAHPGTPADPRGTVGHGTTADAGTRADPHAAAPHSAPDPDAGQGPGGAPAGPMTAEPTGAASQNAAPPGADFAGAPAPQTPDTSDESVREPLADLAPREGAPTEPAAPAAPSETPEGEPPEERRDDAATPAARDEAAAPPTGGRGRQVLRRLVGAVVVLLVLAVGAAVGLAIGLVIVGGL